jgi:hypothetical protein
MISNPYIHREAAQPIWPFTSGSIAKYLHEPAPPMLWFAYERLLANRAHLLTGIGGTTLPSRKR